MLERFNRRPEAELEEATRKTAIDTIFDSGDTARITLMNGEGVELDLEQVYATTVGDYVYCILSPVTRIRGMDHGCALVFRVDADDTFRAVTDTRVTDMIFNEYYTALLNSEKGETR